jgi:hypothetical protein
LKKPLFQVPHGGGVRFTKESLEYRTLLEWIAGGAHYDAGGPELRAISVYPVARILVGSGAKQRLVVQGEFSDGSRRDLSRRVRYTSNDENVATVSEDGLITARRTGETSIMVRTHGKVAVARFAIVGEPAPRNYPETAAYNFIDRLVFAKLKKLGVPPSAFSSDEVFLRRVYLDTIGTLPTVDEARRFLASTDAGKRQANSWNVPNTSTSGRSSSPISSKSATTRE